MRYLIVMLVCICIISPCYAEDTFKVKLGIGSIICEGAYMIGDIDLSYEYRYKQVGVEMGVDTMGSILHDTQAGSIAIGKQMGVLISPTYYIIGKCYLTNFYLGAGVGYIDNYFIETYDVDADVDDEVGLIAVLGFETGDWLVELKGTLADLDIESNVYPHGILEAHSRLDNVQLRFGRRF